MSDPGFPPPESVPSVTVAGFQATWRRGWAVAPRFGIYVLTDPDAPLEALGEAEFEASDERLPYFASLWPAGISLTAAVLAGMPAAPGAGAGAPAAVLDLGCGVGAQGLAAAVLGADVTFLDWDARALDLVGHSAAVLGVKPGGLLTRDWRELDGLPQFDWILGADLLYESRNVPAVLAALARLLKPAGQAWITDPGRDGLAPFLAGLAPGPDGLRLLAKDPLPPLSHGVDVTLLRVGR